MKKLVISLEDRKDRRTNFVTEHRWMGEKFEFMDAINGRLVTHEAMQNNGFSVNHKWRDPFKFRRITKGEVGCFISHYTAWQKVVASNELTLILEDDCILDVQNYDEKKIKKIFEENDIDILYLGYNENKPDEIKGVTEKDCVEVAYPYNTHAYVISPKCAIELVNSGFHRKIIPSDEVLSLFADRPNTQVWALREQCARQASRDDFSSDIEPMSDEDWFQDFNVHAITIGTDSNLCTKLNDSARSKGFEVKNIGLNKDWNGTDMSSRGGGHKINMIKEYLGTLPENDIVLFTDAYDVFYQFDLDTVVRRYLDFSVEILFGAEKVCWPDESMAAQHPTPHTEYRYLNSGTFIGRVGALKELFAENLLDDDDDQLYVQRIWLHDTTAYSMNLDYEGYIFQTHEPNMVMQNNMLYNPSTGCYPAIYHGNGGPEAKQSFSKFYTQVHGSHLDKPFYNAHFGKVDLLEKDMLVVDFMDQSQCERMIEIADNHGGWAPLEGDKFPAYEIRIKELGLWDELLKHWEDNVYPIVEKHWWPMAMYGMRDAFVMRYSVDTQKKLAMHNDASLVTGSVKLNDNYKGASLRFPRQGISNDDVPVGKMILFPGMVTHGHECTELLEGVKYSYTMWSSRYVGDEN